MQKVKTKPLPQICHTFLTFVLIFKIGGQIEAFRH